MSNKSAGTSQYDEMSMEDIERAFEGLDPDAALRKYNAMMKNIRTNDETARRLSTVFLRYFPERFDSKLYGPPTLPGSGRKGRTVVHEDMLTPSQKRYRERHWNGVDRVSDPSGSVRDSSGRLHLFNGESDYAGVRDGGPDSSFPSAEVEVYVTERIDPPKAGSKPPSGSNEINGRWYRTHPIHVSSADDIVESVRDPKQRSMALRQLLRKTDRQSVIDSSLAFRERNPGYFDSDDGILNGHWTPRKPNTSIPSSGSASRSGNEFDSAMSISDDGRRAKALRSCLKSSDPEVRSSAQRLMDTFPSLFGTSKTSSRR